MLDNLQKHMEHHHQQISLELGTGRRIGMGSMHDGLYYLDCNIPHGVAATVSTSPLEELLLQHRRLGHLSFAVLGRLYPNMYRKVSKVKLVCDACQFGKQTRSSYLSSDNRSNVPLQTIHSDVWGPSGVTSLNGYRYFITFIDCCTRTTWVYVLRNKSDVFQCFKDFHNLIKTQYNACVKILRTDNGTEYVNNEFDDYLSNYGIIHQTTCPDSDCETGKNKEEKDKHESPEVIIGVIPSEDMNTAENEQVQREGEPQGLRWSKPNEEHNLQVYTRRHQTGEKQAQGEQIPPLGHSESQVQVDLHDSTSHEGNDDEEIRCLKKTLAKSFEVKDLGYLHYFLGIEVAYGAQGIYLSQRKYILDLLSETGMLECRPASTPIEQNHGIIADSGDPVDKGEYQRLVGRLIYLSHTRPDIAYAVSIVSRYMHDPRSGHLNAVNRILRYLKGCPGKGILFSNQGHLRVEGYTDADWAGCLDDRRSTSGYCMFVGGNLKLKTRIPTSHATTLIFATRRCYLRWKTHADWRTNTVSTQSSNSTCALTERKLTGPGSLMEGVDISFSSSV
uniref:Uncharacterized protein n=1 Tax=Avena sativa TaxID=4498 RepID=A0ACD5U385_AVESA